MSSQVHRLCQGRLGSNLSSSNQHDFLSKELNRMVVASIMDVSFALHPPLAMKGDILISISGKPVFFHFWICTAMMEGNR